MPITLQGAQSWNAHRNKAGLLVLGLLCPLPGLGAASPALAIPPHATLQPDPVGVLLQPLKQKGIHAPSNDFTGTPGSCKGQRHGKALELEELAGHSPRGSQTFRRLQRQEPLKQR